MVELVANAIKAVWPPRSFFEVLIATFVGAWIGGAAAFAAERRKRDDDKGEQRRAAIARTLFRLYQYRQIVAFIIDNEVAAIRSGTVGVYASKPWLDTSWHVLPLELSGIEFLFGTEHATVLVELLERESEFTSLTTLVRERSKMSREVVRPIADRHPMPAPDGSPGFDLNAVLAELTQGQRYEIEDTAAQICSTAEVEAAMLPAAMKRLVAAQRALWPAHRVQYIDVMEGVKRSPHEQPQPSEPIERKPPAAASDRRVGVQVQTFARSHEPFTQLLAAHQLAFRVQVLRPGQPVAGGNVVIVHAEESEGAELIEALARVIKEFLAGGSARIATVTTADNSVIQASEVDAETLARCIASARNIMVADTSPAAAS